MSRVAKSPVSVKSGVEVSIVEPQYSSLKKGEVTVKGPQGQLKEAIHPLVQIKREGDELQFDIHPHNKGREVQSAWMQAGTLRSLVNNMIIGVSDGFERKLILEGVGYKANLQGRDIVLSLGYSHNITYTLPEQTQAQVTNNEIVIKGIDKQLVGAVAADIRAFRKPEPYKGKGVRFADERIVRKAVEKKK